MTARGASNRPRPRTHRTSKIFSVVVVGAMVALVGMTQREAGARSAKGDANAAVRCSCVSTSSCPQIGTLSIPGYKSEPVYCNQLNGSENPGVVGRGAWYYQCVELANRWLVEGVGAPMIRGNADDMCGNADRRSYDVHHRGAGYEPVPGDLLVWDGYRFGHVGIVTSVSSSSIAFANQNYGQGGVQYPLLTAPRTAGFFGSPRNDAGLRAKCVIHPKKLRAAPNAPAPSPPPPATPARPAAPADPCDAVARANDGTYCGRSRQSGFSGGDASTLYTCRRGTTTAAVRCRGGCTMEAVGRPDHCS